MFLHALSVQKVAAFRDYIFDILVVLLLVCVCVLLDVKLGWLAMALV